MPSLSLRLLAAVAVIFLLMSACESNPVPDEPQGVSENQEPVQESPTPAPEPPPPPPSAEVTLAAVGDIMMHTPQLPGAYDKETGAYDFSGFFMPLRSVFTDADFAFANLETPIAGDDRGFKGYPLFNAPIALADAIQDAGFDVLSTANNHTLDQGFSGLAHTLETLRAKGLHPIGTAESEDAASELLVLEKNGIKIAFLSYTYGTNGIPIPKDKPFAVNLIDETRMDADIMKARESADAVVVSLHFGTEYQRMPNADQKRIARRAVEAGADLILGSHPHVVQPYETYQVTQADGTTKEGLIMYSLGNFISNQFGGYKEYGALLEVTFRKTYRTDGTATTGIADFDTIPTWVHKYVSGGKSHYRVLSLDDINETHSDPLLSQRQITSLIGQAAEMHRHLESLTIAAGAGETTVTSDVYND